MHVTCSDYVLSDAKCENSSCNIMDHSLGMMDHIIHDSYILNGLIALGFGLPFTLSVLKHEIRDL